MYYVMNYSRKDGPPDPNDHACFPTVDYIRNHMNEAQKTLKLSLVDPTLKVAEYHNLSPDTKIHFQPFIKSESNSTELLWVHQEPWQQELLIKYSNTVSMIDATYKTTKYDLPLFFITVCKLLKYKFLPRQKSLTLSFLVIKLIEEFIYYKYVFQNFKQTSLYRTYNPAIIPKYLRYRPRSVILYCLHRKSKSLKYTISDINVDGSTGIFEIKGKNQTHSVDFSIPSCSCKDWVAHHILYLVNIFYYV